MKNNSKIEIIYKEVYSKLYNQVLLNNKKKAIKSIVGHPVNTETLLHYQSKSVVYSFKKTNNLYPLLTKTEYLLKSLFISMYSLISKPVYLIKHDKIIIRLFVFLSPKADRYLDTSPIVKGGKLLGVSPTVFTKGYQRSKSTLSLRVIEINKYLKFKQVRPQIIEILKTQMVRNKCSATSVSFTFVKELEKIVKKVIGNYSLRLIKKESLIKNQGKVISRSLGDTEILTKSSCEGCVPPFPDASGPFQEGTRAQKQGIVTHSTGPTGGGQFHAPHAPQEGVIDSKVVNPTEDYPYLSFSSTFRFKLEKLSEIFKKIFKKEVEFEIIKAQLPFQDSNILAQILGYNANNYNFIRMLKILIPRAVIKNPSKELSYIPTNRPHKQPLGFVDSTYAKLIASYLNLKVKDLNMLFSQPSSYLPPFFFLKYNLTPVHYLLNNVELPELVSSISKTKEGQKQVRNEKERATKLSYLSGMNIKLAGRLMTQSIRPRFTVQSKQEGSLARVKVHFTERSRFTGKNKRGAFSFTVSISHVLEG